MLLALVITTLFSAQEHVTARPEVHHSARPDPTTIDPETLDSWSAPYRNWNYYPELVLTGALEGDLDFTMVDGPNVFWHNGQRQMFYFGFNGRGYQACCAVSDDLVHWEGRGLLMSYGEPGAFDHG